MTWWKFWEKGSGGSRPDYYAEGVALAKQELYHDALTSFRLALREKPHDAAALEQMAVAYTHIGLPGEAIRAYERALAIRPNSSSAHYGLAFLLLKSGRGADAAGHLERFLELARSDDEPRHVEHARRTLERITSG